MDDTQPEAYIYKFISLINLKKETETLNIFKYILDNLSTIKYIGNLEEHLIEMKEYDKASEIYNEMYKLDPDFYDFLASALLDDIEFNTAIEFIDYLDKSTPCWEDIYFVKAERLSRFGEYEKTIDACDEILKDFPKHINANTKKTFCLIVLERDEEFKEITEYRIKNNIRPNWALVDKGGYYLKKGDYDKAISLVDETLEKKPDLVMLSLAEETSCT